MPTAMPTAKPLSHRELSRIPSNLARSALHSNRAIPDDVHLRHVDTSSKKAMVVHEDVDATLVDVAQHLHHVDVKAIEQKAQKKTVHEDVDAKLVGQPNPRSLPSESEREANYSSIDTFFMPSPRMSRSRSV